MRAIVNFAFLSALAGLVAVATLAWADDKKDKKEDKAEKLTEDKIPAKVMKTIKDRFPDAKITAAEKEKEGDDIVYDIELTSKGRKYEMDIKEDGTLIEIEKQVNEKDLPKAVRKALEDKYPNAKLETIMEVNKVKDKKETPDHYEVELITSEKKKLEVTVSLDGKEVKAGAAEK